MKRGFCVNVVVALFFALLHLGTRTALAADCSSRGFLTTGSFRAGTLPSAVTVGDFNRDSRVDLAVANEFSANVSVLLGRGDGTFNPAINYPAGPAPSSVTAGDFNGDQRADLAVADASSTNVWILLGNGDGAFQSPVGYPAGRVSRSVTVRDFDRDGRLDLAVANRLSANISVLLGNGNGTFDDPDNYGVGVDPVSVAAGDFDGDTRPDLAVANAALFVDPPSVSVLLARTAGGGFRNAVNYDAGVSPRAVVVGDFNGNGRPDLAVANFGGFVGSQFTNSSVSVMFGRGDGTFQDAVNYRAGDGPASLIAADLNGDGEIDLAVANTRSRNVSVLSGRGNGTFDPAINYNAGFNPRAVASGDFNGDDQRDLVVANDSGVLVLVNICLTNTDLAITKTESSDPVAAGDRLIYTLTVTNAGPVPAPDTTLVDQLPAGLSFVSVTTSLGSCAHRGGTINCSFTNLPAATGATVTITVSAPAAGRFTNTATLTSTATADPNPTDNSATVVTTVLPLVSLVTSDSSASETGPNPGTFSFLRSGSTTGPLTVNYTLGGTASNGVDYVTLSGAVTIPSGSSSATVTVTPVDEVAVEPTENVIATLAADPAYLVSPSASSAAISIVDNDAYRLSIGDVSVVEGNAGTINAIFTVSLSYPSPDPIAVSFFTIDDTATAGSDYIATNGVLTFPPGTTNQSASIAVLGDELNEINETFRVNLFNPTNAVVIDGQGAATINNDDPLPTLSIDDVMLAEGDGGRTNAVLTASLSAASGQTVTVNFATANGAANAPGDYVATNGMLTFAPGVLTRPITVPVNGDLLNEADETFLVNLSGAANAILNDSQGVGTISNDDPLPTITISDVAVTEGNSGSTNAVFTVSLSPVSGRIATVDFATADVAASAGTDYIATNGTVSFAAGTTTQTVAVRVLGERVNEPNETFFVNLSNPTNAIINDVQGAATILDDDPLDLLLSTNSVRVPEGSTNSFAVRLNTQPSANVIVTASFTSGDADLSVSAGTNLTFNPTNWNTNQTVVLSAAEDGDLVHGQALFTVSAAGLPAKTVTATEIDSDRQALLLSSMQNQEPISIAAIQLTGADAVISFATVSNRHYRLERSDEVTGPWRLVVDNVVGTGGLVQVVDIGGAGRPRRFYRVRSLSLSLLVAEGTTTNFAVRLAVPPTNNVVVAVSRTSGSTNLNVSSGQTLTFTPGNWDLPQPVAIGASEEGSTADDLATFTVSSAGLASRIVNAVGLDNDLQSVTNCLGGNAIFGAAPFGDGPFTYSWRKASEILSDQTNSSLVLTNLTSGDSGVYSVQIDGPSYTLTKSGTLVVNTPVTATALSSLTNCPGTEATFSTVASGSGPFTYQWRKGGNLLVGQTSSSLTLSNVSAADAVSYCVVVSGACNSVTNCATLSVLAPTIATTFNNLTNCPGTQATFTTVASGNGPFSYQWRKGGNPLVGQTNSSLTLNNVSAVDAASYCVVVSGACNSVTNCATLSVLTPTTATSLSGLTNCPGTQATFSTVASGSGPFAYRWRKGGSPLSGQTNSSLTVSNVSDADAGSYCVVVSGACNSVTNCATLSVLIPTTATALSSLTNCPGAEATFSTVASGSGPFAYQWSKDGNELAGQTNSSLTVSNVTEVDAGSYCVVVSGTCNSVTNCATLSVLIRTTATAPNALTNCPGAKAAFSTVAAGTGPFSYQWSKDGSELAGQTNSSLTLSNLNEPDTGTYCVVVSGACNSVTNCASLTVVPLPTITSPPTNQTVHVNSNATFSVSATGATTLSYQWRFNGTDLPGETASVLTLASAQPANEGDYTVVVSSICSATSSVATLTLFRDFGDAPDPPYATLLASNGVRHLIVPGFHLGAGVDAEGDGQSGGSANGDDATGSSDDEDGVTFLGPVIPGTLVPVEVVASADGKLDGWLDFDGSGSWADPGDQIFTNEVVNAGTNLLSFQVPLTAGLTNSFARFRFSSAGGLTFDGPASDGEVEDHPISIVPTPEPLLANAALPGTVDPGSAAIKLMGRSVVISFGTVSGKRYQVQRTDDLARNAWVPAGDDILGTGAMVNVTDVEGTSHPSRFYRIVLLPLP